MRGGERSQEVLKARGQEEGEVVVERTGGCSIEPAMRLSDEAFPLSDVCKGRHC